jgi:sugar-specific transcriptional regulator TrmB
MGGHKTEMVRADEVAERLGISRTSAYSVIKELNRELADKGYMTVSGRVSKDYFEQRYFGWKDGIR